MIINRIKHENENNGFNERCLNTMIYSFAPLTNTQSQFDT